MLVGISNLFGILEVLLALGILYGSFTGLFSKEGKYDPESAKIMTYAYLFGICLGAAMLSNVLGFTNVPVIPFI